MEKTILVVDDEKDINRVIALYLKKNKFRVLSAFSGEEALQLLEDNEPNLIVLDILLPGMDGFQVCKRMREITEAPIIFLSCKDEETDKIQGLMLGADDYLSKPFSPGELVARIQANLRRTEIHNRMSSEIVQYPDFELDKKSFVIRKNGKVISFSRKEYELLSYLIEHPNELFHPNALYEKIWGDYSFGDARTVFVHMCKLRKKIERDPANPRYIVTVRGAGYMFVPQES